MEVRVHVVSSTVWCEDSGRVLRVQSFWGLALKDCGRVEGAKLNIVLLGMVCLEHGREGKVCKLIAVVSEGFQHSTT